MANHLHGVCESCAGPGPLYLLLHQAIGPAAVCVKCWSSPDIERIAKAQAIEDARAERNAERRWPGREVQQTNELKARG